MIFRFIITKISGLLAEGTLYLLDDKQQIIKELVARSGGYGKGYLETGLYIIDWVTERIIDKEPYMQYGVGFFAHLEPQFKTERFDLGIHPDGNIPGSLGCIVFDANSAEEVISIQDMIKPNTKVEVMRINA